MNTRFAVAVHILTLLETSPEGPLSSDWIAGSVGTNASLIRRLLSQLAQAGLTTSQLGKGGGALLARPASSITLADVYRATVDEVDVLPIHATPNPACPVGARIQSALELRIQQAERALERELATTTIANLSADMAARRSG